MIVSFFLIYDLFLIVHFLCTWDEFTVEDKIKTCNWVLKSIKAN